MGVFYEAIPDSLRDWILAQKMFWVATAPLSGKGHVNVSPKGGQHFGLVGNNIFWYLELTGSGCETLAHLHEKGNGRITIMLNAFEGAPKIIRIWGKGRPLEAQSPEFDAFVEKHQVQTLPGTRSIILVDIHQVGSSCGWSVPFYEFKSHRDQLTVHWERKDKRFREGKDKETMDMYWAHKSQFSMDGLPGMKRGVEYGKLGKVEPIKKMIGPLAPKNQHPGMQSPAAETLLLVFLSFALGVIFAQYGSTMFSATTGLRELIAPRTLNTTAMEWLEGLPMAVREAVASIL
ncbi:pyridoxamine phosphate oxidase family protein [Thozetella sp. PMI_491]|nr:pyridoxamine phosphate oxidase family protein [Thozetella sp. PMI_491]